MVLTIMVSFIELPNEIIERIAANLDGFTIINLRKCHQRLRSIFSQNASIREVSFDPLYGDNSTSTDVKNFIYENKASIESLNFSRITWICESELFSTLTTMSNLKHLDVTMSSIFLTLSPAKSEVLKLKSLKVAFDYSPPWNASHEIENVHITQRAVDVVTFNFLATIKNLKNLMVSTSFFNTDLMKAYLSIPSTVTRVSFNLSKYYHERGVNYQYNQVNTSGPLISNLLLLDPNIQHAALETLDGISLSPKLFQHNKMKSDIMQVCKLDFADNQYVTNIHMFQVYNDEEFDRILNFLSDRIKIRSTKTISLYGRTCCPLNGFNIADIFQQYIDIKCLNLQPCVVVFKIVPIEIPHPPSRTSSSKKPRLTKSLFGNIGNNVLQRIAFRFQNIEFLQIKSHEDHHSCIQSNMRSNNWLICSQLNRTYLESISYFKKLQYLTLSCVPFYTTNTFAMIFINCELLRTLNLIHDQNEDVIINCLPNQLYLCKNLKVLKLDILLQDVNGFLNSFTRTPSINVLDLFYRSEDNILIETSTINKLLSNLANLNYISVFEDDGDITRNRGNMYEQQKQTENYFKDLHPKKIINLTKRREYLENYINDIGIAL